MSEPPAQTASWPIRFADGASGVAVGYDGAVIHMICERAHPPGRPLEITVTAAEQSICVRGKSAGSKRRDDGRFDVRLRLHSLRREEREQLVVAFVPTTTQPT
jgi:hypothetical protein